MNEALKLFVFLEKRNIEHHFDYINETNYLAWISIYQIEEFYDLLEDMLVYFDEHIPILLQAERLICVNLSDIFEDIDFVEFAELTGNGG
ncbi:hypothetical protein [Streptococcus uberis]|uniref:hypothetical protein n=1 Tax=Streptococcus uberis TaxID=1349 RepID=UPI0019392ED6|nr:hypothetical protein [Streptococcus uberis]